MEQAWADQIEDDWPAVYAVIEAAKTSYGQDMAAFLCFMGVRLLEMHRILRRDGSLYLHIDHTAHAYIKTLMDAVFGRLNFKNEIVWCYKSGGVSKRQFAKKHDIILFYAKDTGQSQQHLGPTTHYPAPPGRSRLQRWPAGPARR